MDNKLCRQSFLDDKINPRRNIKQFVFKLLQLQYIFKFCKSMQEKVQKKKRNKIREEKQKTTYTYCKMIKNVLKLLIKKIKIKILYQKMIKSDGFNFLNIKILLNPMQTYYFQFPQQMALWDTCYHNPYLQLFPLYLLLKVKKVCFKIRVTNSLPNLKLFFFQLYLTSSSYALLQSITYHFTSIYDGDKRINS